MLYKNAVEPLLLEVRRSGMVKTEDCMDKKHYKRVKVTETISRWTEKTMYGQFHRDVKARTDQEKRGGYGWQKVI